ncbi:MAG: DUF6265 family protein [Gemmatimonadota bacterium]
MSASGMPRRDGGPLKVTARDPTTTLAAVVGTLALGIVAALVGPRDALAQTTDPTATIPTAAERTPAAAATGPAATDRTDHPSATLADLAWLAGGWLLERPGERLEEWWSGPSGDSMVGHFRWIRDGELWITELVTITEEAGEIVFRLRHFSDEMTPWEAEDDAFVYRLTDQADRRATFSIIEPRTGRPHRFIFAALSGDSLLVRLEGEEDGRPSAQEFRYGRIR